MHLEHLKSTVPGNELGQGFKCMSMNGNVKTLILFFRLPYSRNGLPVESRD